MSVRIDSEGNIIRPGDTVQNPMDLEDQSQQQQSLLQTTGRGRTLSSTDPVPPSFFVRFFRKCVGITRKPLCCFPAVALQRPADVVLFWLPPFFGISLSFWIFLIIAAVLAILMPLIPPTVTVKLFVLFVHLLCVGIHEFSHATTAFLGGDAQVAERGYLTLDLFRYTPVLSMIFSVLFLIQGNVILPGGAVLINNGAVRAKRWRVFIPLVGPLADIFVGIFMGIFVKAFAILLSYSHLSAEPLPLVLTAFTTVTYFQFMSFFGNSLPLPGLDGFEVLMQALPNSSKLKRILGSRSLTMDILSYMSIGLVALICVSPVNYIFVWMTSKVCFVPTPTVARCINIFVDPMAYLVSAPTIGEFSGL